MNVFESLNDTTNKATDIGEKYIKTSHQYFKLKIFQQLTITMSLLGKFAVIGSLFFIGLIFLAVSGAIAIGEALDNLALGFVIIGGVLLILCFMTYYLRSYINKKVIVEMSRKFFD